MNGTMDDTTIMTHLGATLLAKAQLEIESLYFCIVEFIRLHERRERSQVLRSLIHRDIIVRENSL
jgi:hypothetical protein